MIKLLIYGTGDIYQKHKRIIDWKNVRLEAFIDSWNFGYRFEEICRAYRPCAYFG